MNWIMTDKTMYLMGVRLLQELNNESSRLSDEEQAAIEKTKDVLARFYTQECLDDIDFGTDPDDGSCRLEGFCNKHIDRIEAYNKAAEDGIEQYITEQEPKEV